MYNIMYVCSYDEALQALADSEAKRETAERELKIVSYGCGTCRLTVMILLATCINSLRNK